MAWLGEFYDFIGNASLPVMHLTTNRGFPKDPKDCFVPSHILPVPIQAHSLHYGSSIFEGLCAYPDHFQPSRLLRIVDPQGHAIRFFDVSAPANDMAAVPDQWRQAFIPTILALLQHPENVRAFLELYHQDKASRVYIRPVIFSPETPVGVSADLDSLMFAIYLQPMKRYLHGSDFLRVAIPPIRRIPQKSFLPGQGVGKVGGHYVNPRVAERWAKRMGYEAALLLRMDNVHISEGSTMAVGFERNGYIYTPSSGQDQLQSVTMKIILDLARTAFGLRICERPITADELFKGKFKGAFFTGTAVEVALIGSIEEVAEDGRVLRLWETEGGQPGPWSIRLQHRYGNIVRGIVEGPTDEFLMKRWCLPVPLPRI